MEQPRDASSGSSNPGQSHLPGRQTLPSQQSLSGQSPSIGFLRLLRSPFKFRLYLFLKIPAAFFSGIRVREMEGTHCVVTVPYKWFTKNPFQSTYFACQSMAAEMSTGILAMSQIYQRQPPVSMLVVSMEANYFKKATGITYFRCGDGLAIRTAIEQSIATGQGGTIRVRSLGTDPAGAEIAEFFITWSFKVKASKI